MKNDEAIFGAQFIVDEQDELIAVEEKMLLVSCDLALEECVESVLGLGGICIPAHVDRPAYSVISQLGFIPPDISFAAVELSRRTCFQTGFKGIPGDIPKITASDAHRLVDLQSPKTCFYIKEPTLQEIILALRGEDQRKVVVEVSQK
jgi:PHP family Zn ribbon phosphoesterase